VKIGVYVGSFNPVHCGHIAIINHLLNEKYVDKVLVIPTGNYWDKKDILPIEDRLEMLKVYERENVIINNTLNDIPYTYQILNKLKEFYDNELYLIIGSDNLYKFDLWKNFDEILKHKVLVIPRDGDCCELLINKFRKKEQFIVVENFIPQMVSSTKIRKLIDAGEYNEALNYLHPKVLDYIIKNQLYKNEIIEKCLMKKL